MRKLQNPKLLTAFSATAYESAKANEALTNATTNALDELIASGFDKVTDYISPLKTNKRKADSTSTPEEYEYLLELIKSGLPDEIQVTLASPRDALNPKERDNKRYYTQQVSSQLANFGRQLATRLKAKAEGRTGNQPRTIEVKCRDHLNAVIKACQKAEGASFDVTKVAKACEAAIKLIK
jgi:hypothetical protein